MRMKSRIKRYLIWLIALVFISGLFLSPVAEARPLRNTPKYDRSPNRKRKKTRTKVKKTTKAPRKNIKLNKGLRKNRRQKIKLPLKKKKTGKKKFSLIPLLRFFPF